MGPASGFKSSGPFRTGPGDWIFIGERPDFIPGPRAGRGPKLTTPPPGERSVLCHKEHIDPIMSWTTSQWYHVSVDIESNDEYRIVVPADLGSALRYFRSVAHVSQAQAASLAGVDQPYISRLEHGRFGPALGHALRLLRLVGCEVVVRRTARG